LNNNEYGPLSFSDISTEWLQLNKEKQHGSKPYDTKAIFEAASNSKAVFEAAFNSKAIFEAALNSKTIFEAIQTVFAG
jgi:hypothetical protein